MTQASPVAPPEHLDDMVAEADTGARIPSGFVKHLLFTIAIIWSLFQLWIASPLPFEFGLGIFNDTEARSIHLGFAVLLAFLAFPAFTHSPRRTIPWVDWILAIAGCFCATYLFIFYEQLSLRPGAPIFMDVIIACIGGALLLEATRRTLGPPLMTIAIIFLVYTFTGQHMPDIIAHKGATLEEIVNHQWITTEGVFGIALGVSTSFVFLFVLFGAMLDKAGAGNYFIKVAFSLLGHYRGGPAKAAVVSSGLTGLISGSSIANVVTTGTFTIPMMKRVGFSAEKAGAVEVASSVNGQIMPPVMGAAAFLMVEYIGISYFEVITHAFLPALISYIALVYIVHLEALKANMKGLPPAHAPKPWLQKIIGVLFGFLITAIAAISIYYLIGWIKPTFGDNAQIVIISLLSVAYLYLIWLASTVPPLELDDPNKPIEHLPDPSMTIKAGLHYLLPVFVLVWCLMVERLSPGLSAFWACVLMMIIIITQRPLLALFRSQGNFLCALKQGGDDFLLALATGARNMIGIGIATATAGIIVGCVSQTGVGLVLADLVELLSMGNILLMLSLTAVLSLILGMGLPTTANYIVVSSLLAPVIVTLGQESGLIVPLIAVHLFVFYFGIMADVTPPVGLASFAAAAVSGGDPIRTGFQAFFYSLRTAALPFLFIFNTDLLLINVDFLHGIFIFITATIAMLIFASATQGYFLTRSKLYESALLLLVAFTLFRPGFWMDLTVEPYKTIPAQQFSSALNELEAEGKIKLKIQGEDDIGNPREFVALLQVPEGVNGAEKLTQLGLELLNQDDKLIIDGVGYDSPAQKAGLDFDQVIAEVHIPQSQPWKELFYIPALLCLAFIIALQRRRKQKLSITA